MNKLYHHEIKLLQKILRTQWFSNGYKPFDVIVTFDSTPLRQCLIDPNDQEIDASQAIRICHEMIPKKGVFAKFSSINPYLIPLFFKHRGIKMSHRLQTTTSKGIREYYYLFRLN